MIISIPGGYLLTDTEAPNADGHHPWPASDDFHPRNGENVLLEDLINSEGMKLEVMLHSNLNFKSRNPILDGHTDVFSYLSSTLI